MRRRELEVGCAGTELPSCVTAATIRLAHLTMEQGDLARAEREIDVAFAIAAGLAPRNRFALVVLSCTRSDIRLRAERAEDALADAQDAVATLTETGDPNPYLLAMSVVVEVQALLALGRLDEADGSGRRAVAGLGERVPQARSMILDTVATALREAGRTEEAYDVLADKARAAGEGRTGELRGQDVVVRTGGEEFVVLMPETDAGDAVAACERLRMTIRNEQWDRIAPRVAFTVSVSVATAEHGGDLGALARIADGRPYQAKSSGRDRVIAQALHELHANR